jgi:hypothetical protein
MQSGMSYMPKSGSIQMLYRTNKPEWGAPFGKPLLLSSTVPVEHIVSPASSRAALTLGLIVQIFVYFKDDLTPSFLSFKLQRRKHSIAKLVNSVSDTEWTFVF